MRGTRHWAMGRVALAGAAYFALVFAAGFALGTLRILVLVPWLGETWAVAAEIPVMLAISWGAAGLVCRRMRVPARVGPRLAMGGVAFGLLMAAEVVLAVHGFGRSLAGHLAGFASVPGALGLAGQIGFGVFPALRLLR